MRGFIDKSGNVAIPFEWKYALPFSEGLARVIDEDGMCGYIDKTGTIKIQCVWKYAESFSNGMATVKDKDGLVEN